MKVDKYTSSYALHIYSSEGHFVAGFVSPLFTSGTFDTFEDAIKFALDFYKKWEGGKDE